MDWARLIDKSDSHIDDNDEPKALAKESGRISTYDHHHGAEGSKKAACKTAPMHVAEKPSPAKDLTCASVKVHNFTCLLCPWSCIC